MGKVEIDGDEVFFIHELDGWELQIQIQAISCIDFYLFAPESDAGGQAAAIILKFENLSKNPIIWYHSWYKILDHPYLNGQSM